MKTRKSIIAVLLALITTISFATEKPQTNVQSIDSNRLLVSATSNQESNLEVTISDEEGNLVYYKKSAKPLTRYNKIFDVANLENGDYTLEIKVGNLITNRDLKINRKEIFVSKPAEHFAPYFSLKGDQLILTHLNLSQENYKLSIYNDEGTIFTTSIKNQFPINSGFDLTQLQEGEYKVVLSSPNHEFSYAFKK